MAMYGYGCLCMSVYSYVRPFRAVSINYSGRFMGHTLTTYPVLVSNVKLRGGTSGRWKQANSTIFGTDLRTLCGFHLPEAGWRGTRGSGIKWAKSRRRSVQSADRAACLFPSFLLLSGRQRQATQNTIKTQKTTQMT